MANRYEYIVECSICVGAYPLRCWHGIAVHKLDKACARNEWYYFSITIQGMTRVFRCRATELREAFRSHGVTIKLRHDRNRSPEYSFYSAWRTGLLFTRAAAQDAENILAMELVRETPCAQEKPSLRRSAPTPQRKSPQAAPQQHEYGSEAGEPCLRNPERCVVYVRTRRLLEACEAEARWYVTCSAHRQRFTYCCEAVVLRRAILSHAAEQEWNGYELFVDWQNGRLYASADPEDRDCLLELC